VAKTKVSTGSIDAVSQPSRGYPNSRGRRERQEKKVTPQGKKEDRVKAGHSGGRVIVPVERRMF